MSKSDTPAAVQVEPPVSQLAAPHLPAHERTKMDGTATPANVGSMEWLERDMDELRALNGLHIGQLTLSEMEAFGRLRRAGLAECEYSGAAGFLGLGRLRLTPSRQTTYPADVRCRGRRAEYGRIKVGPNV